eukprot:2632200-Prymnesium_polylepis.1
MGMPSSAETRAASDEPLEQPAPMIAVMPSPKAFLVSCRAPTSPSDESHLQSKYAYSICVLGRRWSPRPSVLLLISRRA